MKKEQVLSDVYLWEFDIKNFDWNLSFIEKYI